MDQQQVPLETPKESQSEKNKLLSQPQHLAIQLNNIPEQAVGDPLDADFVEGDHDNQQNALLENQLLAEIDNHMASKQYDVAYKKINLLLSNNEANPEVIRKKAFCETKMELFTNAMTSLQNAVDLDPKMKCCLTSYHEYKLNKQYLIKSNDI